MKKIFLLTTLWLSIISVSFAQSASFEDTYNKLVTEGTTTISSPSSGAMQGSVDQKIVIKANVDENNQGEMTMNMKTIVTSAPYKRGISTEMDMQVDASMNAIIEQQNIKDLRMQMNGKILLTDKTVYMKLNSLSIDSSKLPVEMQGNSEMIVGYVKSSIVGKWIKAPLTKAMKQSLQTQQFTDPNTLIALFKQYPLLNNMGYTNGAYTVTLNPKSLTKIINTLQGDKSLSVQDTNTLINAAHIKGTLSDSTNPVLTLQGYDNEIIAKNKGTLTMTKNSISGKVAIDVDDVSMNIDINTQAVSANESKAHIALSMKSNEFNADMVRSIQSLLSPVSNYTLIIPKKAMTMRQLEKQMSDFYK